MLFRKKILWVLTFVALSMAGGAFSSYAADPYFKGKTITVIVGFSGGGIDTNARIFTKNMPKYIPGNPTIVIKSMPGSGSIKAQNYVFEKAKPDGLTLSYNPYQAMAVILDAPDLRFKYQDFTLIGGLGGTPTMAVARIDCVPGGLKRAADIVKAKKLKYAGRRLGHNVDTDTTPALDLLGVKYLYVPGYRSSAKTSMALQSGEANISGIGPTDYFNVYKSIFAKGDVLKALWYYPRQDGAGNYISEPTYEKLGIIPFLQVYKEVHGKDPEGPLWDAYAFFRSFRGGMTQALLGPPNMDKEVTAILREAFKMTATLDEETKANQLKINKFLKPYIPIEEGAAMIQAVANAKPEIVQFWKDKLTKKPSRK